MSYTYRSSKKSYPNSKNRSFRGNTKPRQQSRRPRGQYIDPARFVKQATGAEAEVYNAQHKFADFNISEKLKSNIEAKDFYTPSPIQDQAIPVILAGKDVIGVASTGTGKTAAFAIPILERLSSDPRSAALIIAPTRELAQQIEQDCRSLGKNTGVAGALLIGGTGMAQQLRDLKHRPRIVIGTPGRIKDHIERRSLSLQNYNMVVVDEVDRMLDMGFVRDVSTILESLAPERQSLFFSATIDAKVRKLIEQFTKDPYTITLQGSSASENVHQDVVRFQTKSEKLDKLHDILINSEVQKVIVFDETQRNVERLSNELIARGFSANAIHGGKTQGQRMRAMAKFKQNEVNVLVATDVAARGIDVADITHVINFSLPNDYDDYIHRIGRAGRAGRVGYALTFVEG